MTYRVGTRDKRDVYRVVGDTWEVIACCHTEAAARLVVKALNQLEKPTTRAIQKPVAEYIADLRCRAAEEMVRAAHKKGQKDATKKT